MFRFYLRMFLPVLGAIDDFLGDCRYVFFNGFFWGVELVFFKCFVLLCEFGFEMFDFENLKKIYEHTQVSF